MGAISTWEVTGPAVEAWRMVEELARAHRARLIEVAAELELSPGQAMALRRLRPGDPLPMRELARTLNCDNSNVTALADALEQRHLICRRAAPHDRRMRMLEVTPEGIRLRARLIEGLEAPPAPLTAMAVADQHLLCELLRRALGSSAG